MTMLGFACARGLYEARDPKIIDKKVNFLKIFIISYIGHQLLLLQTIFLFSPSTSRNTTSFLDAVIPSL